MKKFNLVRTIILAGSLLLQVTTLCVPSRGGAGAVDLSFDPGTGANSIVKCLVVQPDGKVIIGGQFTAVNGMLRTNLARLNTDGSPDATFNPDMPVNDYDSVVSSLALQPDGKVLVCSQLPGIVCDEFGCNSFTEFHFRRLNHNGTLDSGFNPIIGMAGYPAYGSAVARQSDGKVLIGGDFNILNGEERSGIARLNTDGSLDASFNPPPGRGGNYAGTYAIVVQPDGKVLIGGSLGAYHGTNLSLYIARLNSDGSLDSSFNPGTGPNAWVNSIALQPDGKVLIGGDFTAVAGTNRIGIARLNPNGGLDAGFNAAAGMNSYIFSVALQSNGKVIIGGSFASLNGTNRSAVARLNANGSLDATFDPGTGATGGNSWPGLVARVHSTVLQGDGKVLIGGDFTGVNGISRPYVARLYGDAVVNPSLTIARSNASVIVSWPASATGYSLQESTNVSLASSWFPIAQSSFTNASQISVTVPATGRKFFRLKSP